MSDDAASRQANKFVPTSSDKIEEAFMQLLASKQIDHQWEWDRVLRETISHPAYRAIDSMPKRKAAFAKYLDEKKQFDREERDRAMQEVKNEFFKMLNSYFSNATDTTERIRKDFASWRKVNDCFYERKEWKNISNDKECENLWNEWLVQRRKLERAEVAKVLEESKEKLLQIMLSSPGLNWGTRWVNVMEVLESDERYKCNRDLLLLEPIDKLNVWEECRRKLETDFFNRKSTVIAESLKKELTHRQNYCELLDEFVNRGIINGLSKWKDIFPLIKDDSRFLAVLSNQTGSTPLDLFFDVVDKLEQKLEHEFNLLSPLLPKSLLSFDDFQKQVSSLSTDNGQVREGDSNDSKIDSALYTNAKSHLQVLFQLHCKKIKAEKRKFKKYLFDFNPTALIKAPFSSINKSFSDNSLSDEIKESIFNKAIERIKMMIDEYGEEEEGELSEPETKRYRHDILSSSDES